MTMKFAIFAMLTLAAAGFGLYVLFPAAFKPSPGGSRKRWAFLFGAVLVGEMLISALCPLIGWWLPKGVSTYSGGIDMLFYAILAVTGVTFIGVSSVLIYVLFKYGHHESGRALYTHGNHRLEILWSSVPGAVLLLLAIVQIPAWLNVKAAAEQSNEGHYLQLEVTARQWEWRMRYPSSERLKEWSDPANARKDFRMKMPARPDDVRRVNEVHCVKGKKMLVHLRTQDVIHSFFLPQLRLKQDALPGKTIPVWFQVEEANCVKENGVWKDGMRYDEEKKTWEKEPRNIWELACAEYCGARHSLMRGKLFVHATQEDFEDWLKTVETEQKRVIPEGSK